MRLLPMTPRASILRIYVPDLEKFNSWTAATAELVKLVAKQFYRMQFNATFEERSRSER